MFFKIVSEVLDRKTIASGKEIRELKRLVRVYGGGAWRKRKGNARIQFKDGTIVEAELHWYEAHGIGKKEFKIKRLLDDDED